MELLSQQTSSNSQQGFLTNEQAIELLNNQQTRREIAKTFRGFCVIYLSHYLTLPPADFHGEIQELLADWRVDFLNIVGFRGSAKSSFVSLAFPLWAALEKKSNFILPFSDTEAQARLTISNIRHELEDNELLIQDYGDQSTGISKNREWTQNNLLFHCGARIMSRSRGQRVRGLRHRQHRPDLVIIDDPEELEKVQKKEYRDKTERWLRGDIIPAIGEFGARLIIAGNILHMDALMARLKNDPLFTHREYPLINAEGKVTWRAKYPTDADIARQEAKVRRTAFMREYLLKVIPPEGQEVKDEWIKYYDVLPQQTSRSAVGVDLAISKKETADYTAMVGGLGATIEGMQRIFILPNPINERLSFHETIQSMRSTTLMIQQYATPLFFVEDVAYQRAAIEEAERQGILVKGIRPGTDKRARLRAAATLIQNGTVLFPRRGAEDLIAQLTNFGIEEHDDLMDAFVYLILGMSQQGLEMPKITGLL